MAELLIRLAVIGIGCVTMFAFSTLGYAVVYEFDRCKCTRSWARKAHGIYEPSTPRLFARRPHAGSD